MSFTISTGYATVTPYLGPSTTASAAAPSAAASSFGGVDTCSLFPCDLVGQDCFSCLDGYAPNVPGILDDWTDCSTSSPCADTATGFVCWYCITTPVGSDSSTTNTVKSLTKSLTTSSSFPTLILESISTGPPTTTPTHSSIPLYTGSGDLLVGYCSTPEYILIDGPTVYWAPAIGCVDGKTDCCPFSVPQTSTLTGTTVTVVSTITLDVGPGGTVTPAYTGSEAFPTPASPTEASLSNCPADYQVVSGGCCPSYVCYSSHSGFRSNHLLCFVAGATSFGTLSWGAKLPATVYLAAFCHRHPSQSAHTYRPLIQVHSVGIIQLQPPTLQHLPVQIGSVETLLLQLPTPHHHSVQARLVGLIRLQLLSIQFPPLQQHKSPHLQL
jgi:Zn-finger protein